MKNLVTYFLLAIIFFISCNKKEDNSYKKEDDKSANVVDVSYETNNKIKATSFIEDYKIVQLATNNDNLIFQISKVHYSNKKIYILDIPGNCVFIFNDDGVLNKKLNKRGNGPGEYIQITDFFVDEDNLLVLDYTQQAILRYDDELKFINKTNFKLFGSKFICHNKTYWNYNEKSGQNPDYQFSSFTEKENSTQYFLSRHTTNKDQYNWAGVNVFALNNKNKYLSPRFNDTIYSISQNNITPEFIIDFNERKFPNNEDINNYDIFDPNFSLLIKHNYYVSNKYLIFDFILNKERLFCIHDIEKNISNSGFIENDLIKEFRFFPRWGNDDFLIEEVGSEILKEHFNSSPQFEKFIKGSEEDNPLIIIYKLKI